MEGILIFEPDRWFVGKKKQYPTKEDFVKGVGVYQFVDKKGKGNVQVWVVEK